MTVMGLSQASADVKHYTHNYSKEASFLVSQAVAQLNGTSGLLKKTPGSHNRVQCRYLLDDLGFAPQRWLQTCERSQFYSAGPRIAL